MKELLCKIFGHRFVPSQYLGYRNDVHWWEFRCKRCCIKLAP